MKRQSDTGMDKIHLFSFVILAIVITQIIAFEKITGTCEEEVKKLRSTKKNVPSQQLANQWIRSMDSNNDKRLSKKEVESYLKENGEGFAFSYFWVGDSFGTPDKLDSCELEYAGLYFPLRYLAGT